jgi:hypothetical protein
MKTAFKLFLLVMTAWTLFYVAAIASNPPQPRTQAAREVVEFSRRLDALSAEANCKSNVDRLRSGECDRRRPIDSRTARE